MTMPRSSRMSPTTPSQDGTTLRSRAWFRPVQTCVGLLVVYYGFPDDLDVSAGWLALSGLAVAAGVLLVGWTMIVELSHIRRGEGSRGTVALAMLLVLLVMAFSAAFFIVERMSPDQIIGLDTRTDSLYFTLSTMTTVGYGDVHAEGQLARVLVCAVIVFNVVVVASLVRAHTRSNSL
jgi:voltage-gated potassium channel